MPSITDFNVKNAASADIVPVVDLTETVTSLQNKRTTVGSIKDFVQANLVDECNIFIETPTAKTYTLDEYAMYGYVINQIAFKSSNGTGTLTLAINGSNITWASALSASTVQSVINASGSNTVNAGQRLTLTVASPSALTDLAVTIKYTRSS